MNYLHRELERDLLKWLDRREILAIKGPRQAGKTTLLERVRKHLTNRGVPPERVIFLTFEDRDLLDAFSEDPKRFISSYLKKGERGRVFFLLDEVQYVDEVGQKLKLLFDLFGDQVKFIITGSSSLELASATGKYLVGRVFSFHLYPFDFREFLETKEENIQHIYEENHAFVWNFLNGANIKPLPKEIFGRTFQAHFEDFVLWGGYPEVVKSSDPQERGIILKNIYDNYLTKDIVELLKLQDVTGFRKLIVRLASQIGSLLQYQDLMNDLQVYFGRIKQELSVLEETYVISLLSPFYRNRITELKKSSKVFFVDTGLRNCVLNNFNSLRMREDAGGLVENAVFSSLLKSSQEIRYWRTTTKTEVDFVISSGEAVVPIEVKSSSAGLPRSLQSFLQTYKPKRALISTKGEWGLKKFHETEILFAPVWYL